MTFDELQLVVQTVQVCLNSTMPIEAFAMDEDPMTITIMCGGTYADKMYTISDSTSKYEIESLVGDTRENYIKHVLRVIKDGFMDVRQEILKDYMGIE